MEIYSRAVEKHASGEYSEAIPLYRESIEENPNDPFMHANLAMVLFLGERELGGSIRHIDRAIELDPQEPIFNSIKGDIHFEIRNLGDALEEYVAALRKLEKYSHLTSEGKKCLMHVRERIRRVSRRSPGSFIEGRVMGSGMWVF